MENILRNIFGLPVPETRILRTADGLTIMASPALDSYTSLEKGEVPELLAQFVANNGLGPEDAARLQREADLYTALHAKFRIGDAELGVAYFDGIPHIVSVDNEVALAGMRVGEMINVLLHDLMGVRDETEVISNDRVFGSRRKGRYFGEVNEIDRELFESDFADHIAMIGDRVDGPDGAQRMRKELLDAGYSKSEVDTLVRDIQDVDVRHDLETIVRGNGEAVVSADGKLRTKSDYIAFRETDEGDLLFRKHRNEVVAEARQLEGEAKVRKAAEFPVDETGAVQRNVVNSEMMDPCPIAGRATGMAMPCGLGVSPGNLKGRRVSIQSVEGGSINGEYMGQMGDQLYLRLDNGNVRVLDTNQLDIHSMEEVPLPKQDTMVEVRTADGPLRGKFQGVDEENGLLFVEVNGEVRIFDEQEVAFASLRELPSKSKVAAKIAKNRLTGQTYVGQGPRKVVFNPQNIKKSGLDLGEGETLVAMHIDGQTGEVRLLDPTRTSSASVKDGDIVTKVKVNNRGRIIEVEGTRISRAGQLEKVAEGSDFGEYVKSTAREFNEEFFPSSRIPPARTSDVANIQSGKRGYTAVGDLHGSYDYLMDDLNFDPDNPLIRGDPDDIDSWQWTGGDAVIVQSGDIYDRGPDSLAIREAMNKLDGQARRQGGRVVRLMGNHELGFVDGSPFISMSEVNEIIESGRDVRAYIDMVRGHILEDVKEGRIVAATVVNGELFTHAGVSFRKFPEFRGLSPQGVAEEINRRFVRAMESGDFSDPIFDIGITGRLGEEGVAQIKANPALLDDPENIGGVFWVRRAETKDLQDFNPAKHRKRGYAQYTGHEAKRTKDVQGIEVVDLGDDAFGNPVKLGNLDVGRTKAYGGGKGRLSRSGDDAFENLMDRGLIRDEGIPTTQQRAGEGSVVNGELINPDVAQPCVRVVGGAIHGFAVGCPVGYWDPGDEFPITTLAEARAESVVRSDPADVSHLVSLVGTESERLGVDLRWGADIDPAVVARMDPEIKQTIYEAFRANPEETLRKLDPELVDEVLAERGIDLLDYLEAAEDFVPVPLLEDVREGRVARKVIPASGDEAELRAAIGTLEEARGRVAREGLPKREVQSDLPIDDDHLEVESFAGYRERVAREGLPEVEVLYGEERFRVATLDEVRAERQRPQVELSGCPFIGRAIGGCQGRGTVGGVACEKTDGVGWRRLDGEEITLEQVVALESTDSGVDLFAGGGRLPADAVGGIDPTVRTAIADAFRDDPISVSGKVNNNILGKMGLGGREEFESALREQGRVAALLDQALQDGFSVGIHPGTGEITSGTRGAQYINGRYGVVVDDSAGITTVLYESGGQIHVAEKGMFFDDFDGRSLVSRLNDDPQVQSDLERIASGLEMRGGRELRSDMGIISEIRKMHGRDAPRYEGFFPEDVLEENREAYRQLRRAMAEDPPDAIFTIERGGGFIGESLVEGTVFADKLSKVPKFRPGSTRVGVDVPDLDLLRENIQKSIDSGSTTIFISNSYGSGVFNGGDLKSQVIDPLLRENPGVKLDLEVRDYEYFRQKLQEKIDAGETKLAITDTYFGGRFSRELRSKVVKPLLRSNPDIEIDIYWMRETFGFEPLSAEGMPTLTPFQGSIKPTSPYASRVEVHEARTRVVLGDDMDLIFDGSDDPLVIFDSEGKVERLVRPETTSREALVNLLTEGSEQSN